MNEAHEQVTDVGSVFGLKEERIFAMKDGPFEGLLAEVVVQRRPRLVEAIHRSCEELMHSSTFHTTEKSIELCARIDRLVSHPAKAKYVTSTGAEANEVALNIPKKYTGEYEIASFYITCDNGARMREPRRTLDIVLADRWSSGYIHG